MTLSLKIKDKKFLYKIDYPVKIDDLNYKKDDIMKNTFKELSVFDPDAANRAQIVQIKNLKAQLETEKRARIEAQDNNMALLNRCGLLEKLLGCSVKLRFEKYPELIWIKIDETMTASKAEKMKRSLEEIYGDEQRILISRGSKLKSVQDLNAEELLCLGLQAV